MIHQHNTDVYSVREKQYYQGPGGVEHKRRDKEVCAPKA